jgi:hypothetical protein
MLLMRAKKAAGLEGFAAHMLLPSSAFALANRGMDTGLR